MLKRIIVILVVLACAAGGIWWLYDGKRQPSDLLTLYGNVDIRQVDCLTQDMPIRRRMSFWSA